MGNCRGRLQGFLAGRSRRRIGLARTFAFAAGVGIFCLAAQGQPTQLAFVKGPTNTQAGSTITPSVKVAVEDAGGAVVTTDSSNVTVAVSPGTTFPGTLKGTLTVAAVNGVATFNTLSVTAAGTTYTLQATDGALTAATSATFTVTAAAPPSTYALKVLGQFIGTNGDGPASALVMDGSGNLYGTTGHESGSGYGTVYEITAASIASGSPAITPLASFNDTNGAGPYGAMVLDGFGNLYGTTTSGGANNAGTVFEVVAGSKAITRLASFASGSEGSFGGLLIDGSGDLFGTTYLGGDSNDGSVFELVAGASTITTLASLNGANGIGCHGGLAMDKFGNFYGTAWQGGANSAGTVYELPAGSSTITAVVSFAGGGVFSPTGETPEGTPVVDGNGNIYGTTSFGGPADWGTAFEITAASIAAGNPTITTLCSFGGGDDEGGPIGGLLMDGSGNLFGTTQFGGMGLGLVFEIAAGTRTVTPLASFNGTDGDTLASGVIMDGSGNLYGTAIVGGAVSPFDGTVYELSTATAAANTLIVQSTPPTGLSIGSSTGDGGMTDYTVSSVAAGTTVNLQAPATDPATQYAFSQWWVNDVAQASGQQTITFTTAAATTAVAQYIPVSTLSVQSTPLTGIVITSGSGDGGMTNYTVPSVAAATSVNLAAPATDPTGYTFENWTVNGAPITPSNKSVSFTTLATATTAVAQYTANTYTLTVQSTPVTGLSIGSNTGNGGATNYTDSVAYNTSVDLQAPATDPAGLTFSYWIVNGTVQTSGVKEITFTMPSSAVTAVVVYTLNTYTMTVQSTPPTGLAITSGSSDGGTTNYTVPGVAYGTMVNLVAPATDPAGYTFSQWTLNGATLGVGQKSVTFPAPASFISWGSEGSGNGQFFDPTGVAVAGNGNVYVVDSENDRIQEFTSAGAYVTQWGGEGSGNGLFSSPTGIALDGAGNVYVADTDNQLIQEFTSAGVFVTQWGGYGSGNGQLEFPAGIAVDIAGTGNVYVVDTYNERIQEFTSAGVYVTQWGSEGSGNGQFDFPTGIAVGSGSNVYVADTYNDLIQEFTSAGGFLTQWGGEGSGNGQFELPAGVAVDSAGNVYVADTYNGLIQEFTSAGVFLTQWGGEGSGLGQFEYPAGVALNSAGNIYVADTDNQRIQEVFGQNILAVAQYTTAATTYTLTVESTPVTGVAVTGTYPGTTNYGPTSVAYSTSVTLTAPDVDGYIFSGWSGVAGTPSGNSITFTMPAGTVTATANYTANNYTLTVQSTPVTGVAVTGTYPGTTNYGPTSVGYGASVTLTAPAVTGYTFSGWTGVTGTPSGNSITFTMPAAATTAEAVYTPITYTLTVQSTPVTGLSIASSNTGQGGTTNYTVSSVAAGTSVNLQAPATDPSGLYTFLQWTLNGVAQTPGATDITFTMPATATTAVAVYTPNTYTLTVDSTPVTGLSIGSPLPAEAGTTDYTVPTVAAGTLVTLEAPATDPSRLYTFTEWLVNGAPYAEGVTAISFAMPAAATTALAVYEPTPTYILTVESTPMTGLSIGSPLPAEAGTTDYTVPTVAAGTLVTLEAPATDPSGLYTFTEWLVNGAPYAEGATAISFVMTAAATTALAVYEPTTTYILTVDSTPVTGLVITSTSGDGETTDYTVSSVAYGTPVNLTAPTRDPDGYTFERWTVNNGNRTAGLKSITFTMTADTRAIAEYTVDTYTLTVDSAPPTKIAISSTSHDGGTTPYTVPKVAYGTTVNLVAPLTAPNGDTFSEWTVNKKTQTPPSRSVTFTVTGDTTAEAVYASDTYALTVESTPLTGVTITSSTHEGGKTPYTDYSVKRQASVSLQAPLTDPVGYAFVHWTVNGKAQTPPSRSVTFTMTADTTAIAEYTVKTYTLTVESMPPTKIAISSTSGDGGTTPYPVPKVAYAKAVHLEAPATDPAGYTFSRWTVNKAAQTAGQKSISFTMPAFDTTAEAEYTVNTYTLTVDSAPPTGIVITSTTGDGGTTIHTVASVAYGTPVNLVAPARDPAGYTFERWTVNNGNRAAGLKSITFTMTAADTTAVAEYTTNTYRLTVESTPPPGIAINSTSGDRGTTPYPVPAVAYARPVNLEAPATDPAGYTFSRWTVNKAAQTAGQKSISFTMPAFDTTAEAEYMANIVGLSALSVLPATSSAGPIADPAGALTVQSTPATGLSIGSSTGHAGTTNYTVSRVAQGRSVNLQAPETDPPGYTFSQWMVNGAAQDAEQKSITFLMPAAATAVAQYTPNTCALTVQSAPPTGVVITSGSADGGMTNYTMSSVEYGTSATLQAPATDPVGYTFLQWTLNGTAQTAGQKAITFTVSSDTTAVAEYTANAYTLTVQSAPATGVVITSSIADSGTTNYTAPSITYRTIVTLAAPETDPAGYTFSQWMLSGTAQTGGQKSIAFATSADMKSITFAMSADITAVAQYTPNTPAR